VPFTVTTLAQLKTTMVQRWDQVVFWTPEEARLAINETLREWNLLTGTWRTRVPLSVTGNSPEIALPSLMTYGMRVTTAAGRPLQPTSIPELDYGLPPWRLQTTATGGIVPTIPTLWAPLSLTRIAIWPTYPGNVVNALQVDGVLRTPILVNDGDYLDLAEPPIDIVVDMALHIVAFKEAAARWRSTRPFFDNFLDAAVEKNGHLKQHQVYRRWAGLDRQRDLQPTRNASNQIQGVATQFSSHDTGGGGQG